MTAAWLAFDAATVLTVALFAFLPWRREQLRAAAERLAAAKAWHLRLAGGEHQCCRVINAQQCGLWCCHDGACVDYDPGEYLPEPLLHPLAMLRWRLSRVPWTRCPLCAGRVDGCGVHPETAMRADGDDWRVTNEHQWRFWPCGCEGREVL